MAELSFANQINLAGVTVLVVSFLVTQSVQSALIIAGAHAVAHYIAGKKK